MDRRVQSRHGTKREMHPHAYPTRSTLWISVGMLVFGILGIVCSAGFLPICEQFVVTWLHQDEYVATELEVDDAHESDDGPDCVSGRIIDDGTELRFTPIPAELYEPVVHPGKTRGLLPQEEIKGRRLPIWYAARALGLLSDPRALYRGEETSFDTGQKTLIAVMIQLTTAVVGMLLVFMGWRRLRWFKARR